MATEANIVVTLDIGGSGAKAVAYDAVRQRCVASAAVPYPSAAATLGCSSPRTGGMRRSAP